MAPRFRRTPKIIRFSQKLPKPRPPKQENSHVTLVRAAHAKGSTGGVQGTRPS